MWLLLLRLLISGKVYRDLEFPGDYLFNLYVCNYVKIRKIRLNIDIFQITFDVFIKNNNNSSLKMPNLFIENERMSKCSGFYLGRPFIANSSTFLRNSSMAFDASKSNFFTIEKGLIMGSFFK